MKITCPDCHGAQIVEQEVISVVSCDRCAGSGYEQMAPAIVCSKCHGAKKITISRIVHVICTTCKGIGEISA